MHEHIGCLGEAEALVVINLCNHGGREGFGMSHAAHPGRGKDACRLHH
jgi:hypothetical protein